MLRITQFLNKMKKIEMVQVNKIKQSIARRTKII